jgi:hypothetical protein
LVEGSVVKPRIFYAAVTVLVVAVTAPAMAEPMRMAQGAPDVLPTHEIVTIVRSTGLTPLDRPLRRGTTYVLRAVGANGREMRVVVDARYGDILSVTPTVSASRAPAPDVRMGPYEPIGPGGYLAPERPARGVYQSGPPIDDDDDDEPMLYRPRPSAPVPGAQTRATPGDGDRPAMREPHVIMAPEPGENGLLPPPPERFPQRAAPPGVKTAPVKPAAKPAAVKRAAASPPLPKPRPNAAANSKPAAETDASPLPPPIPESKPADDAAADKPADRSLPH